MFSKSKSKKKGSKAKVKNEEEPRVVDPDWLTDEFVQPLAVLDVKSVAEAREKLRAAREGQRLGFSRIGITDDVFTDVLELVGDSPSRLKALDVSKNGLGSNKVSELGKRLATNSSLVRLNLSGSGIGVKGISGFLDGMNGNRTLCELFLYNNALGDVGCAPLAAYLASSDCMFRSVSLRNNVLGEKSGELLAKALRKNKRLVSLDLWMNSIGDKGAVKIADALQGNDTLKSLILFFNGIRKEGGLAVARMLHKNKTLEILDLDRNEIGNAACMEMAEAITANSGLALRKVQLYGNEIEDEGAIMILEALGRKKLKLDYLGLDRNQITAKSGATIAKFLSSASVTQLNLKRNQLGVEGLFQIAKVLRENKDIKVENLVLLANDVSSDSAKARANVGSQFVKALLENDSVKALDVSNNKFGLECESLVSTLLQYPVAERRNQILQTVLPCRSDVARRKDRLINEWERDNDKEGPEALGPPKADKKNPRDRVWTQRAMKMSTQNMYLFVLCLKEIDDMLKQSDDETKIWNSFALWTMRGGRNDTPMIHHILSQTFGLTELREFIVEKLNAKVVRKLFDSVDARSRTLRSVVLASLDKDLRDWAAAFGTYLRRYQVEKGPPVHYSKTCVVFFATDVIARSEREGQIAQDKDVVDEKDARPIRVALKIMRDKGDFIRELGARDIDLGMNIDKKDLLEGADLKGQHRFEHTMRILAVHPIEKCVVMDQADRTLFEAINTERITARKMRRIERVAWDLAQGLAELHGEGWIHGDLKPRNVLRYSEKKTSRFFKIDGEEQVFDRRHVWGQQLAELGDGSLEDPEDDEETDSDENVDDFKEDEHAGEKWLLIDMDASAEVGKNLSHKCSTGYIPPEVAKVLFGTHATDVQVVPTLESEIAHPSFDVWSFGVILFELLSGTSLFLVEKTTDNLVSSFDKAELVNWLILDEDRLSRIPDYNNDAQLGNDLVRRCLVGDPENRITLGEILDHEFVKRGKPDWRKSFLEKEKKSKKRLSHDSSFKGAEIEDLVPPMPKLMEKHFFLSHAQKEASAIVKDIWLNVRSKRCAAWLDVVADDLTLPGMERGIEQAKTFVFVLTRTALFRPYCIREFEWALKHNKDIIFIVEEDTRFDAWNPAFVPWIRNTREFRAEFRAMKNWEKTEDFEIASARKREIQTNMKIWDENLNMLLAQLEGDVEERIQGVREAFDKHFNKENVFVYRRRYFETDAMVNAMLERAGVTPPELVNEVDDVVARSGSSIAAKAHSMFSNVRSMVMLVVCDEKGESFEKAEKFAQELSEKEKKPLRHQGKLISFRPKLDPGGVVLRKHVRSEQHRKKKDENVVAVIMLADGIFSAHKHLVESILSFWTGPTNEDSSRSRVAALQIEAAWTWKDADALSKSTDSKEQALFQRLFVATEVLFFREKYEHEAHAMYEEIKKFFLKKSGSLHAY